MAVRWIRASENTERRCNPVTKIITLPPGMVMALGGRPKPAFFESRWLVLRQRLPVSLAREFGVDLVDGVFITVMKCLRS